MSSINTNRFIRSALYLPASNPRAIEKSRTIAADALIFDLEDAVHPDQKTAARSELLVGFEGGGFGSSLTCIRCNTIGSEEYRFDLEVIARCSPSAIMLPKISTIKQVQRFKSDAAASGLAIETECWFMIESVAGLLDLREIVEQGTQNPQYPLTTLVIGTNDIASGTGIALDADRSAIHPWLMQSILIARHFDLLILDGVWNQFSDMEGYKSEARQASQMGFDGKSLIHPSQVDYANCVFLPTDEQIASAKVIVNAFSRAENQQAGVINLDGKMVERLHLQQAEELLARVQKIKSTEV